jgi:hypothetical protein
MNISSVQSHLCKLWPIYVKRLDATLKYFHNLQSEFLICGEMNVDYLSDNNQKKQSHY